MRPTRQPFSYLKLNFVGCFKEFIISLYFAEHILVTSYAQLQFLIAIIIQVEGKSEVSHAYEIGITIKRALR